MKKLTYQHTLRWLSFITHSSSLSIILLKKKNGFDDFKFQRLCGMQFQSDFSLALVAVFYSPEHLQKKIIRLSHNSTSAVLSFHTFLKILESWVYYIPRLLKLRFLIQFPRTCIYWHTSAIRWQCQRSCFGSSRLGCGYGATYSEGS